MGILIPADRKKSAFLIAFSVCNDIIMSRKGLTMENIRKIRVSRGMTQTELSEKTGICRFTIIKLEKKDTHTICDSNLKAIAKALKCSELDILGNDEACVYLKKMPTDRIECEKIIDSIKRLEAWAL